MFSKGADSVLKSLYGLGLIPPLPVSEAEIEETIAILAAVLAP